MASERRKTHSITPAHKDREQRVTLTGADPSPVPPRRSTLIHSSICRLFNCVFLDVLALIISAGSPAASIQTRRLVVNTARWSTGAAETPFAPSEGTEARTDPERNVGWRMKSAATLWREATKPQLKNSIVNMIHIVLKIFTPLKHKTGEYCVDDGSCTVITHLCCCFTGNNWNGCRTRAGSLLESS